MTESLSIASYNSQGHSPSRIAYIDKLLQKYNFVFIQEHWLRKCQFDKFTNELTNAFSHSVSPIAEDKFIIGRPYGGCSIVWKNDLKTPVTPVIVNSTRICAVSVVINHCNILLCNVHMPCNKNDEFIEVLGVLEMLCKSPSYDSVILGGDFNLSFDRVHDPLIEVITNFMAEQNLKCCLSFDMQNINYTFESKINGNVSTIDHFMVSDNMFDYVYNYHSIHEGDNCSDHSPIVLNSSSYVHQTGTYLWYMNQ